jgi:transposase
MMRIGKLYKIEETIRDKSPKGRLQVRQEQAKPVVEAYFAWFHSMDTDELDHKLKIGDAILYSINQGKYLCLYLEDGYLAIDNNECERSIKIFGIVRRNWLFYKSIAGAQSSAIIYSITESAKLNGLRPYNYLTYQLDTMRCH